MTADELVGMVDELTAERIFAIETAYAASGFPHPKYAITAARQAGRLEDVTAALRRMAFGVQMYGLLNNVDTSGIVEAAKNVGGRSRDRRPHRQDGLLRPGVRPTGGPVVQGLPRMREERGNDQGNQGGVPLV